MPAVPQDPNKQWKLRNFLAGRFRNGRREIRVEWDDGTKTWEPGHCFESMMHLLTPMLNITFDAFL